MVIYVQYRVFCSHIRVIGPAMHFFVLRISVFDLLHVTVHTVFIARLILALLIQLYRVNRTPSFHNSAYNIH